MVSEIEAENKLVKLKVDIDCVGISRGKAGGEGVNFPNPGDCPSNRFIHGEVTARAQDFCFRYRAIGFDSDLDGDSEGASPVEKAGGLVPLAVKSVVDQIVIPTELILRGGGYALGCLCGSGLRFLGCCGIRGRCLGRSSGR